MGICSSYRKMKKKCRQKQAELSDVTARLRESEKQLEEEKRINVKRRNDMLHKQQLVLMCENQVAKMTEEHQCTMRDSNSKRAALDDNVALRAKMFTEKELQFLMDTANFEEVTSKNARLQAELKEIAFEHYKMTKRHHEELERRKQSSFDTKMLLDHVLRNTIKMFTSDYNRQALQKMDEEAAFALKENVKLNTQFDQREQMCENLIRQQKMSYEKLMKLRLAKEVVGATTIMHEQSAEQLRVDKETFEKQQLELHAKINELERDIKEIESRVQYKAMLLDELAQLKTELRIIKVYRRRTCKKSVIAAQKLLEVCLANAEQDREFYSYRISEAFLEAMKAVDQSDGVERLGVTEAVEGTELNNTLKRMSRHSSFFSNSAKSLARGAANSAVANLAAKTLPMTAEEEDGSGVDDETLSSVGLEDDSKEDKFPSVGEPSAPVPPSPSPSARHTLNERAEEPLDHRKVWNSECSDIGRLSTTMRKFLRQQRKL